MKYVDLTFASPAENLACDEALLELAEIGGEGEMLRFWEPGEPFVVVGYANQVATEVDLAECKAHGVQVFRRCTGGGTVLQGRGCLNYSLILRIEGAPELGTITGTNRYILERQQKALAPLLQTSPSIEGHTDLTLRGVKFSGNAQRRKRKFLIFHGTFLLQFDISLIEKFLRMPSRQPEYRHDRSHTAFLTNLEVSPASIELALRKVWGASQTIETVPMTMIENLSRTKYSTAEWNFKF